MAGLSSELVLTDGTMDFSGGVNSIKATTVASDLNQNGLKRNELAWLINATVRDCGISPRDSWQRLFKLEQVTGWYHGGSIYEPDEGNPYLVFAAAGKIYMVDIDTGALRCLSDEFELYMPADSKRYYFCQAEKWLIIQAGDYQTLPLFWDGTTLRRSNGIIGPENNKREPGLLVNELPAAGPMDYYMGRVWYAQGRSYSAGDIVGNTESGSIGEKFRDSVLSVTENPLAIGGDGFIVPTNAGNIRALKHLANLDASLGQGRLIIFTRKEVYALQVPVTRQDWIDAGSNNAPLQTVIQMVNGAVNDASICAVNGDLFYQSLEPGIRSLISAARNFEQWGNIPISANIDRVLRVNDRELMYAASGIVFGNRLLQTAMPKETERGIAHEAICVLDFLPVSSWQEQRGPVWEGIYEGLDIYQMFVADFGGRERAFMLVSSRIDSGFELWEIVHGYKTDADNRRIQWVIETPAFTFGQEFRLKRLVGGSLWVDNVYGVVDIKVEYRPDGDPCWTFWDRVQISSVEETPSEQLPEDYRIIKWPAGGYNPAIVLPRPVASCSPHCPRAPVNMGYQFQLRLTIDGYCRIRGLLLYGEPVEESLYRGLQCSRLS